jgi:hypothetical protein
VSTAAIQAAPASRLPRTVTFVAVVTGLFSIRLIGGGTRAVWAMTGGIPLIFVVGGVGDFLAGLTAPFVTFALMRSRSRTTWLLASLWHLYSACDFVFANAAHVIGNHGLWATTPGAPMIPVSTTRVVVLSLVVLLDVASILLLNGEAARDHFE